MGLARQHLSGVSFEYQGDAVPLLSPCRFTGSEVRTVMSVKNPFVCKGVFLPILGVGCVSTIK